VEEQESMNLGCNKLVTTDRTMFNEYQWRSDNRVHDAYVLHIFFIVNVQICIHFVHFVRLWNDNFARNTDVCID
jgi:hypothetical protein